MHVDRIAGVAPVAGSVRGLGVCDVLRVELVPVQRAGLEAQLSVRTAALEQRRAALEAAAGTHADRRSPRRAELDRGAAEPPSTEAAELDQIRDELRILARVREDIPTHAPEPFALTGPAGLVLELVGACLAAAVACADARLAEGAPGTPWAGACERELQAAAAWIATALDCRAVEAFCFEPDVDPLHAW
jgi:hypothetical protein